MLCPCAEVAFTRCGPQVVSPLVSRMVAKDVSARAVAGLRCYLVGHAEVAVIDPDPPSRPLLHAILEAVQGRKFTHVILTHTHGRRSPLALELAARTGAQLLAAHSGLVDGLRIDGSGFTLEAMATPGHTADHFSLALPEQDVVIGGDLVCGWAPIVHAPPGADLGLHLASLERVRRRNFSLLLPAQGPPVGEPAAFLAECLEASHSRERQILARAARMQRVTAWGLAAALHAEGGGQVEPASAHAVLAYLVWLSRQGRLVAQDRPGLNSSFLWAEESRAA